MNTDFAARKSILIVEDEPEIAKICLRVLNREGFEVEVASNEG
jgi:DNA-binding response OmpR family regulator